MTKVIGIAAIVLAVWLIGLLVVAAAAARSYWPDGSEMDDDDAHH